MKMKVGIIFILLTGFLWSQSDTIYVTVQGDTATIWHTQTHRNCGSIFIMEVELNDNHITVTEVDTGNLAFCMCYFDLSVTIGPLTPGQYTVNIFSTDTLYGTYWDSTTFTIEGITVLDHSTSDCLTTRDDSSTIAIAVSGDAMILNWHDIELNCCVEPLWNGWLSADTFQVTMIDTGEPCECLCDFDLTASFGPFEPGTYTLDFWNGAYGYPTFTIGGGAERDSSLVLSQDQSDCYSMTIRDEDLKPQNFTLYQNFPNPFNPFTTIQYKLSKKSHVRLTICDLLGREVALLVDGVQEMGAKSIVWDASGMPSGIYFVALSTGTHRQVRKVMVLQ